MNEGLLVLVEVSAVYKMIRVQIKVVFMGKTDDQDQLEHQVTEFQKNKSI